MNVMKHFGRVESLPGFLRSRKFININNDEVLNNFNETFICFKEPIILSKMKACSKDLCWSKICAILKHHLPPECINLSMWEQLCEMVGVEQLLLLLCHTYICVPFKLASYIVISADANSILRAARCNSATSSLNTTATCLYELNSTYERSQESGDSTAFTTQICNIPLVTCSTGLNSSYMPSTVHAGSPTTIHTSYMPSMVDIESSSSMQTSHMSFMGHAGSSTVTGDNIIGDESVIPEINCHVRISKKAKCKKRKQNLESLQHQSKSVKKTRRSKRKKRKKNSEVVDNRKAFECALQIPTDKMLYNLSINEIWPPYHVLSKADSVEKVLDNILSTRVGVDLGPVQREKLQELLNLLPMLMARHKRLSHKRLLEHHARTMRKRKSQSFSSSEVYLFVSDVVRRVMPMEMFGSRRNHKIFLAAVRRLTLLGLHHTMALGMLLQGMRTSGIKWLICTQGHAMRQHILAKVMMWLFTDYVMVLLKSFFYITESSSWHYKLFFYWKRQWQILQDAALKHRKFVEKSEVKANHIAAGGKQFKSSFGIGRIRFIPKENGLREIQTFRNVDPATRAMARKAKFLLCQLNEVRGFRSLTSLQDSLHSVWLEMDIASQHRLYLVKTDIQDAYGSIDHRKLVAILLQLRQEVLAKGSSLSVKVYKILTLHSGNQWPQVKHHFVFDGLPALFPANSLIIFLEKNSVDGRQLFSVLLSYVQRQVVRVHHRWYWVTEGLPHGTPLSPALCDLYYGTMESRHLRRMCAPSDRLIRAVDDYLFVTHSEARAQQFTRRMNEGFTSYKCIVNRGKTQANVMVEGVSASSVLYFCGMEIEAHSLEVKGSYEKMRGCDVAYCLQLKCTSNPGRFLKNSLRLVKSLKLSRVFLDETYNSAATILQTVYKAALLSAFRIHAIVRCMFIKVMTANRRFLTRTIAATAAKLARCVSRNSSPPRTGHSVLSFHMVRWLTFRAFYVKFSRHGGRYKGIVHDVQYLLHRTAKELDECTLQMLQEATRNELPDPFHTMK